jgi:hypothetical protein
MEPCREKKDRLPPSKLLALENRSSVLKGHIVWVFDVVSIFFLEFPEKTELRAIVTAFLLSLSIKTVICCNVTP